MNDKEITEYINSWTAPTWDAAHHADEELWSEVLPRLWQGGTHDDDVIYSLKHHRGLNITVDDFDFVTTLYSHANPVDWFVQEIRFGIYDSDMQDFDIEEIVALAGMTHRAWKSGKRTLIRCQAGWNRSGLVTALVLMLEGYTAMDAITLIRERRSPFALCNRMFEEWLLRHGETALGLQD